MENEKKLESSAKKLANSVNKLISEAKSNNFKVEIVVFEDDFDPKFNLLVRKKSYF